MAGPKLWGKHLSLKEFDEDDFSVMNIEEFLEENNIKVMSEPAGIVTLYLQIFLFRQADSCHRKTVRVRSWRSHHLSHPLMASITELLDTMKVCFFNV